jgi:hypothetical protein
MDDATGDKVQSQDSSASLKKAASEGSKKALHQEINNGLRLLQTSITKDDGTERDINEHFKAISRLLDNAVERTRKRPEQRTDAEWLEKKAKVEEVKKNVMKLWVSSKKN